MRGIFVFSLIFLATGDTKNDISAAKTKGKSADSAYLKKSHAKIPIPAITTVIFAAFLYSVSILIPPARYLSDNYIVRFGKYITYSENIP